MDPDRKLNLGLREEKDILAHLLNGLTILVSHKDLSFLILSGDSLDYESFPPDASLVKSFLLLIISR